MRLYKNAAVVNPASRWMYAILVWTIFSFCLIPKTYASFDFNCNDNADSLTIEFQAGDMQSCESGLSGTYFLNPYNDTRINLSLLLEDRQLGKFDLQLVPGDDVNVTHYEIPFYYDALFPTKAATTETPPENNAISPVTPAFKQQAQALGVENAAIDNALIKLSSTFSGACVSNNIASAQDFLSVLTSTPISPEEKRVLAMARVQLAGVCVEKAMPPLELNVTSAPAKEFATYLRGASAFYNADFKSAEDEFKNLLNSSQMWLKETATYLLGRVFLNAGDGTQAEAQFKNYLAQYPQGIYQESAHGLFRRVYWLDNNQAALSKALADEFMNAKTLPAEDLSALINEVDAYLLFPISDNPKVTSFLKNTITWDAPLLSALAVLTQMRVSYNNKTPFATLQAQQAVFAQAGLSALHEYLLRADEYFVQQDYAAVIQNTNAQVISAPISNVTFSLFTLRALAYESLKQWNAAETVWLNLLKYTQHPIHKRQLQLALALHYEKAGRLERAFAENSPVTDKRLLHLLIQRSVSAALLEKILNQAHTAPETKAVALKTLLLKHLIHNHYAEFMRIYRQYPSKNYPELTTLKHFQWAGQSEPEYSCPALLNSVQTLVKTADDANALNCIGEFTRLFFYSDYSDPMRDYKEANRARSHNHYLGDASDNFKDKAFTRLDFYLAVIENPNAAAVAKAFALYRAINCFASSGNNHCGTQNINKSQRASWFKVLKNTYKNTSWAEQQRYYW